MAFRFNMTEPVLSGSLVQITDRVWWNPRTLEFDTIGDAIAVNREGLAERIAAAQKNPSLLERPVTDSWDRRGKTRWEGVALTPDVFREPVTLDDCRTSKPGELRFAPFTALCRFEVEADRNNQRHMY